MAGAAEDSRAGTNIGPYRLLRLIRRGDMGEVYEAEYVGRHGTVALKLFNEGLSRDPNFCKRLERGADSVAGLHEPHVVPIHDRGVIDGVAFVDMRFIDGTDLRTMLNRDGPMTPTRAVAIVTQIASALDAAHASGLLHHDVKPESILVTRDDFAYLVGLGVSRSTTAEGLLEVGNVAGRYAYMAPERFTGGDATYRADVYALACVLFETLTGAQPYAPESVSALITAHLTQPIPRPSVVRPGVTAEFDAVISRGMAKDSNDRYVSAGELARAARDALESRDVPAPPPTSNGGPTS